MGKIEGFGTVQGTYQGAAGGLLWVKVGTMEVGEVMLDNAFTHAGDITVDVPRNWPSPRRRRAC